MNNINNLVSTINATSPKIDILYIDFSDKEVDFTKIKALKRNLKLSIFNGKDVSDIREEIETERRGKAEDDYNTWATMGAPGMGPVTATVGPKVLTKSVALSHNKIDSDSDILNRIKLLGNLNRNGCPKAKDNKSSIFDIDLSNLTLTKDQFDRRVLSRILWGSNHIAVESRVGHANFIISNENIINNIDVTKLQMIAYIDNSIVDEIIIGRKSEKDQPGICLVENTLINSKIITEIGFFPHKNYLTIKYNI